MGRDSPSRLYRARDHEYGRGVTRIQIPGTIFQREEEIVYREDTEQTGQNGAKGRVAFASARQASQVVEGQGPEPLLVCNSYRLRSAYIASYVEEARVHTNRRRSSKKQRLALIRVNSLRRL
jgi:hypothetical protein